MKSYSSVALAVAAAALAGSATAQDVTALEEVVVTATKREQTLQDVPVAVSVTPVETIQKASIQDITDLASIVTSLRVTTLQTSTQTNFVIRGFGNGANNPGIEPSVGVFIDGVYRSRSAGAIGDLIDVSRVEVLRGPQSTLFGQNASAGVISVVTQKPQFEWSGLVEGTLGNYSQQILKSKVTGPISDTVAFSVSSIINKRDGYFRELVSTTYINDRDRSDVRGQLLWKASDALEVRLIADLSNIDELCCGVSNLFNGPTGSVIQSPLVNGKIYPGVANTNGAPFDRAAYLNKLPRNIIQNSGFSLHLDWDLGDFSLASISSSRNQKTSFDYDFDFTSGSLGEFNVNTGDIDTLTQELRLSYDGGSAIRGLIGAYYFDEKVKYDNTILLGSAFRNYAGVLTNPTNQTAALQTFPTLEAALGLPVGTFFRANTGTVINTKQDNDAYNLFGQLDFDINDQLTLTAGVAFTSTKKDVNFASTNSEVFSGIDLVGVGYNLIRSNLSTNPSLAPLRAAGILSPALINTWSDLGSVADGTRVPCYQPTVPVPGVVIPPICNPVLGLYALQFLSPVVPYSESSNDSKTTYTVRLVFEASGNLNVYGGVSTGFKATSWNLSRDSKPFAPATPARSPLGGAVNPWYPRYGTRYALPEESTVKEIGVKGRWERIAVNLALFDQEIKNFQANTFLGTGFVLGNAGKQSTRGFELETQFKLSNALQIDFSATYLDPEYDSYPNAQGPNGTQDLSGRRPAGIHEWSVSTGATHNWSVGAVDGFVRADYLYESKVQAVDNLPITLAARQVNTLNASVGFAREGWDFMVWGRNLTDDDYLLSAFPAVAQTGSFSGYPNQPRTYGVTIRKNF
jgi:outer membrane receptor protein involved in Fe transport